MSKEYIIIELNDTSSKYCAVVISLTASRVDYYLNDITKELKRKYVVGYIIFDMLTTNGIRQRYYETFFNGKQFDLINGFGHMLDVPKNIIAVSNNTFANNINLIKSNPILPDKFIELFIRYVITSQILS